MSFESNSKEAFSQESWQALHYACSVGHIDRIKSLLAEGADATWTPTNRAVPNITPLHIACSAGNIEAMLLLLPSSDINKSDQWGFTPLHYATVARRTEAVSLLLSHGASASIAAKSGNTAKDLAEELHFDDIVDALASKIRMEKDPTLPKFKQWLSSIGGGEYLRRFLDAGYDLPFIARHGLKDADLDCVGVPVSKMGLRRKMMDKGLLKKFYTPEESSEEEEDEEGDRESADESDG